VRGDNGDVRRHNGSNILSATRAFSAATLL
jgi:hypothetical protein